MMMIMVEVAVAAAAAEAPSDAGIITDLTICSEDPIIRRLILRGADPEAVNKQGKSPLDLADTQMVDYIQCIVQGVFSGAVPPH